MKHSFTTLPLVAAFLPTVFGGSVHRRTAICGSKGWDDGTDSYAYRSNGTYAGCSTACQRDPVHCKSFSYDGSNCNLYNVPVAGNFEKDSSSPFTFYDASCIAASSSTTSSSTSSKSSTTTATTTTTTTTSKISTLATSTKTSTISSTTTASASTTTKSTTKAVVTTTAAAAAATTTTTTSKSSSSTTISTSASSSASTSTPPCPLPTWTLRNFIYINSTHNLDCAGADHNSDLCYTGKDPQPQGYGPPDSVSVTIDGGIGSCHQQNPGTVPLRPVGNAVVRCSGSSDQLEFYGDSNSASSIATFNLNNPVYCDSGASYSAWATVKTEMVCSYDSDRNATCTLKAGDVVVPASGFGNVVYPSN